MSMGVPESLFRLFPNSMSDMIGSRICATFHCDPEDGSRRMRVRDTPESGALNGDWGSCEFGRLRGGRSGW